MARQWNFGRAGQEVLESVRAGASLLGTLIGLLVVGHVVNTSLGGALLAYGILPRSIDGLLGIFVSPFLHISWEQLLSNSVWLLILGPLVMLRRRNDLVRVGVLGGITAGFGTWLVGPSASISFGAHGVVFACFGFLMARGIFARHVVDVILSALAAVLFGGMLLGVLPTVGESVSSEARFFGFLGGFWAVWGAEQLARNDERAADGPAESPPACQPSGLLARFEAIVQHLL